jgi:hypothetical protein
VGEDEHRLGDRIGPISVAEPQKLQFFLTRLKK